MAAADLTWLSTSWRQFLFVVPLALGCLTTGCATGPNAEEARVAQAEMDLATESFQRGRYREALEHVTKSIEVDDGSADAHYLGAMTLLVFCAADEDSPDCRYDDAERHVRAALAIDPNFRDAKNALGVILVHQKRAKEAVAVLRPLSKDILYRSPEKAWGNLGWALLEAGQTDEAISALKRSVAAQPLFCVGHYRLGLAYEKKRDFAAARQALTRALSIEEGGCDRLQEAFSARARVYAHLGLQAKLREDLQRCQRVGASTPTGRACARRLRTVQ
jgi:Tfp pilus assembly protein PilF